MHQRSRLLFYKVVIKSTLKCFFGEMFLNYPLKSSGYYRCDIYASEYRLLQLTIFHKAYLHHAFVAYGSYSAVCDRVNMRKKRQI